MITDLDKFQQVTCDLCSYAEALYLLPGSIIEDTGYVKYVELQGGYELGLTEQLIEELLKEKVAKAIKEINSLYKADKP